MDRRTFIGTLAGGLVAAPFAVDAQQPRRVPRVGWLSSTAASMNDSFLDAYRQAMRELGYIEGRTVITEYRFADGRVDRLADLATSW